jgi:hypothetical protein
MENKEFSLGVNKVVRLIIITTILLNVVIAAAIAGTNYNETNNILSTLDIFIMWNVLSNMFLIGTPIVALKLSDRIRKFTNKL